MKITIRITANFKKAAKPLLKKYHSLSNDLLQLEKELVKNPKIGTPLGKDVYKIRLRIASKAKGKSGGARVITLVETTLVGITHFVSEDDIVVNLLSIYDKSDVGSISDKELRDLLKNFYLQ